MELLNDQRDHREYELYDYSEKGRQEEHVLPDEIVCEEGESYEAASCPIEE